MKFLAVASLVGCAALSFSFDRMFVFGDSLNDAGNVYGLTGGTQPAAPYWNGRYSNGPVWVEGLATRLGVSAQAAITGGTNFAWGGAELNSGAANSTLGTPNVGTQIGQMTAAGMTPTANDLVIVSGGGNDFFNGATNPNAVAADLVLHMNTLYGLGARKFMVPNLPLLGYTPGYLGGANQGAANALSLGFNQSLAAQLGAFRASHAGATVAEVDVMSLFNGVLANPGAFGFSNVTQSYMANGNGADPDGWLFWDNVHPTRRGHAMVAERAFMTVPEPASWVAVVFGMLLLRRKARQ